MVARETESTTSRLKLALGFALALTAAACQDSYSGKGYAETYSETMASVSLDFPPTGLESVTYKDSNRTRRIDRGDKIILNFRTPVDSIGATLADLELSSTEDTFGEGAFIEIQEAPSTKVVLRLGISPRLSIFRTYVPNDRPNRSPAALSIVGPGFLAPEGEVTGGPVRITVKRGSVLSFLGESYPDDPTWESYKGTLHAHTGFSDGKDDPDRASRYARDKGQLDFFAVTDHLEYLDPSPTAYAETHRQLDRRNRPGKFVTLAGYEWGGGPISYTPLVWYNHINVIGDPELMPVAYDLETFYQFLKERPHWVVGQFNHPGTRKKGRMEIDLWDDLAYDARADRRMRLMRCDKGKHDDAAGYIPALDRGWHVSPQSSQDNHDADWGTANKKRTGVWAPELGRREIMKALREMRTFSTSDPDASIRAVADGQWAMGSTLFGWGSHDLEVEVFDGSGDGYDRIELITLGGEIAETYYPEGLSRASWTVTVDPDGDRWYYFRAFQTDGAELYSAPFFIDR